jgi:hypothetical protein
MPNPKDIKAAAKPAANTVVAQQDRDESKALSVARTLLRPSVNAAVSVHAFSKKFGDVELTALVDALAEQSKAINGGDMTRAEAMLIIQAHTLDAIFNALVQRATLNMGEYLDAADKYMRLALKAQSQCRTTLQTLGELKNPQPVAFVKQANIANGPQQVNNGEPAGFQTSTRTPARAEENKIEPNELLEENNHEQWLDTRAASAAGRAGQAVAALGEIDRA